MVIAISLGRLVVDQMPYNLESAKISVIELLYEKINNTYKFL